MDGQQLKDNVKSPRSRTSWVSMAVAGVLLGGIGFFDYNVTGWDISFSILYLVPVCIAAWFSRRLFGAAMCFCAAGTNFGIDLSQSVAFANALWGVLAQLGTMLGLFAVLSTVRLHVRGTRPQFFIHGTGALAGILACMLWVTAFYGERFFSNRTRPGSYGDPATILSHLGADTEACLSLSRPVLLGSRNPRSTSCVRVIKTGEVSNESLSNMADFDGGPGTRVAALFGIDRGQCRNHLEDYRWHQSRLKSLLENMIAANEEPRRLAVELSDKAMAFQKRVHAMTAWPSQFAPTDFSVRNNWLGFCFFSLNEAVKAKNLVETKRWTTEFAAAAFELADLHRWVDLLARNHLAALEYQEKCQSLFESVPISAGPYDSTVTIGQFPAGLLGLHGMQNYFEVERQAERIYSMVQKRLDLVAAMPVVPEEAIWVPPSLRESFMELRGVLGEENRKTWDLATRTPYERSYLVNMLYRAASCGAVRELTEVLRRFNALKPQASVQELMDVLMYRNHSFAGLEWPDRYQPQLMATAAAIKGNDLEAFLAAYQITYNFRRESTYGSSYTLRDTLASKKIDCVRATDMIGALCRDSGHVGYGHIRWCAGTDGHTQAAYLGDALGKVMILDGLIPAVRPEVWPDAFFNGHAIHPDQGNISDPYSVELYVRGIDNYLWAGGYIIRGDNAGTLMKAGIPFLAGREKPSCQKAFSGPYPPMKAAVAVGRSLLTLPGGEASGH